jgi:metal-sulfur cluster biosynthetic enzyme
MLVYGVYEIISYVVSAYYFVIRPNRINKANYRLEIRKLKAEQKVIQAKIDTDKGLIDAHKIASLKPEKEVANIKAKNITSLKEIISDTRSEIIPKMNQAYRDRYEVILDKCSSLLSMAEENGSILVEISKIYNIYLNDINSIVMKATDENCNDIITMLDNFERYIDRKIEKFKNINDFSVQSEISTLNNIFNEDIKG